MGIDKIRFCGRDKRAYPVKDKALMISISFGYKFIYIKECGITGKT